MISPNCPVVIPTYKNRPDNLVQHLDEISDNEIYVFCYKDDYENYKQYDCKKNVTFVQLDVPWRSIQKKRRFIQEYFVKKPEIKRYIMIDDDILQVRTQTDNGKVVQKPLNEGLAKLEELHIKYNDKTFSGPAANSMVMAHATKDYTNDWFIHVFIFENEWLINNPDCRFRDLQNVAEDVTVFYDSKINNFKYYRFEKIYFAENTRKNNVSIASSRDNIIKNHINGLRVMKENCKLIIHNFYTHLRDKFSWGFKNVEFNPYYATEIKPILEKYLPGFEDLNNEYPFEDVVQAYDEIAKTLVPRFKYKNTEKNVKIYKHLMDEFNKVNELTDFYE